MSVAGRDVGTLLTELQVYASTAGSPDRDRAVTALVTACGVAGPVTRVKRGQSRPGRRRRSPHVRGSPAARRPATDRVRSLARAHLDEAGTIADRIGERNGMRRHFGPTNVRLWRLGVGVELDEGGRAYEEVTRTLLDPDTLGSRERSSALHLDLARALVQDGPDRDAEAIRHLDTADRLAPQRIRMDPIARELVTDLSQRARRRVWELDSLCNRFGLG
jgi:hypothetical protein